MEIKSDTQTHIPAGNKRLYRLGQAAFILIVLLTAALAWLRWWT